ncbi:MAG: hypothetical protein ACYS8X_12120 [Planctomycetota bacterium]
MRQISHGEYRPSVPHAAAEGPSSCGPETIDLGGRTPREVVHIMLKVLCGYESVSVICQREGIELKQYYQWHDHFIELCKQSAAAEHAARRDHHGEGDVVGVLREAFESLKADWPQDISAWADRRLRSGWRTNGSAPLATIAH